MKVGRASLICVLVTWVIFIAAVQLDLSLGQPIFLFFIAAGAVAALVLYGVFGSKEALKEQRLGVLVLMVATTLLFAIFGSGYLAARKQEAAGLCKANLLRLKGALEFYEESNEAPPDSLESLVPEYAPAIPSCPLGGPVYVQGYSVEGGRFTLICKGSNHKGWTSPDYPRVVWGGEKYEIRTEPKP